MELHTFVRLAKEYQKLGWAVQEQLDDLLEDPQTLTEKNPTAVAMIESFMKRCARISSSLAESCDDYLHEIQQVKDA